MAKTEPSRTQQVLALVRCAFDRLERPLRLCDVREEELYQGLPHNRTLSVNLSRLLEQGRLVEVARVIGLRSGGTRVFQPADAPIKGVRPVPRASWSQVVLDTFTALWEARSSAAAAAGRLPRPITTTELRHVLEQDPQNTDLLSKEGALTGAVQTLTRGGKRVRAVGERREAGSLLVPASVSDDAFEIVTIALSNAELAAEALARACRRLGRPIATALEVKHEIDAEPALAPSCKGGLSRALDSAARTRIVGRNGARARQRTLISRVGVVGNRSYFCVGLGSPEHATHLDMMHAVYDWETDDVDAELAAAARASIPELRAARLVLTRFRCESALRRLADLQQSLRSVPGETVRLFEERVRSAEQIAHAALEELPGTAPTANDGGIEPPRIPIGEAIDLVRKLSPDLSVQEAEYALRWSLRHWDRDGRHVDGSEVRIYAAMRLGGRFTAEHAMIAARELGPVRDPSPVLSALDTADLDRRLAAAACAAFLPGDDVVRALGKLAATAPEPGVRMVALWGFGFVGGQGAKELLQAATTDRFPWVQKFARESLATITADPREWFAL